MSTEPLKSCPFCGSDAERDTSRHTDKPGYTGSHWIICPICGAQTDTYFDKRGDEVGAAMAAAAWNRRAVVVAAGSPSGGEGAGEREAFEKWYGKNTFALSSPMPVKERMWVGWQAALRTRSPAGGQWRPISEVPTDSVGPDFLALYHDGFICTESPVRTAEDWRDSGVTHWMPVPSPPDDERKENVK